MLQKMEDEEKPIQPKIETCQDFSQFSSFLFPIFHKFESGRRARPQTSQDRQDRSQAAAASAAAAAAAAAASGDPVAQVKAGSLRKGRIDCSGKIFFDDSLKSFLRHCVLHFETC